MIDPNEATSYKELINCHRQQYILVIGKEEKVVYNLLQVKNNKINTASVEFQGPPALYLKVLKVLNKNCLKDIEEGLMSPHL